MQAQSLLSRACRKQEPNADFCFFLFVLTCIGQTVWDFQNTIQKENKNNVCDILYTLTGFFIILRANPACLNLDLFFPFLSSLSHQVLGVSFGPGPSLRRSLRQHDAAHLRLCCRTSRTSARSQSDHVPEDKAER